MDKENPLIGEPEKQPLSEFMEENQPETRPEGVPDHAVWRGGLDGGTYIIPPKRIQGEEGIYYSEIYNDFSGTLLYKGRFRHKHSEGSTNKPIDPTSIDIHMGWDGSSLLLEDRQYLQALELSDKD